ncbi:MAG TPA: hypothetical protein VKF62_05960, partial [Planctomycetota bacterium]|nr:hypothetical protein [Planctomycetota bacterium]
MHPLAFLLLQAAPLPVPQVSISNGTTTVEVNAYGALVGAPAGAFRTVDGPIVGLHPGFAEWFGIAFDDGHGRVEAVGLGNFPDWGNRTVLRCVDLLATPDAATARTRVGDLEVRSAWGFEGAYLIVTTTFVNLGSTPLRNLLYSREWRSPGETGGWIFPTDLPGAPPAPHDVERILWMPDDLAPGASQSVTFSYVDEGALPLPQVTTVPLVAYTSPSFPGGLV